MKLSNFQEMEKVSGTCSGSASGTVRCMRPLANVTSGALPSGIHEPKADIDMVRAPIANHPAAIFIPGAETERRLGL